jgi:hypothetical protein
MNDWLMDNSELVDIFNESGLKRLRTCSLEIWNKYMNSQYIDMRDIKQFCPTDTWSKAAPAATTPPDSPPDR